MIRKQKISILILAASMCLFSSCRRGNNSTSTTSQIYLYMNIKQNTPGCPLTLTVVGPTTFQDDLGSEPLYNSLIAFNADIGNYIFYFNGATDGVSHYLSGSETITCSPSVTTSCASWTYTVKP